MKAVLRKELGQTVVEPTSPAALLSGADVLFTGREFFVGLSQWTNTEGAVAVAATWPEYPCTPVKVGISLMILRQGVCDAAGFFFAALLRKVFPTSHDRSQSFF